MRIDDSRLEMLAESFELSVDDADAIVRIDTTSNPPMVFVAATRDGFIRLAAMCLQAAAAPIAQDDYRSQVVTPNVSPERISDDHGDEIETLMFQRMRTWPEPTGYVVGQKVGSWLTDRFFLVGCAFVAFLVIVLVLVGLGTVIQLIFGA